MYKETLNGKRHSILRPEDLKETDIFSSSGNASLTQLGSKLQGFFIEQDELGRVLQDGEISDEKCLEVSSLIAARRTELENLTGRKIPKHTNGEISLRTRFEGIISDKRKALSNLTIVDKDRELVKL